jgi:hypothetical protein
MIPYNKYVWCGKLGDLDNYKVLFTPLQHLSGYNSLNKSKHHMFNNVYSHVFYMHSLYAGRLLVPKGIIRPVVIKCFGSDMVY